MTNRINEFITGVLMGFVGGFFIAGLVLSVSFQPTLHPLNAYCRGFTDGVGQVLMDNGAVVPGQFTASAPVIDDQCVAMVKSNVENYLRGPLLPGE